MANLSGEKSREDRGYSQILEQRLPVVISRPRSSKATELICGTSLIELA